MSTLSRQGDCCRLTMNSEVNPDVKSLRVPLQTGRAKLESLTGKAARRIVRRCLTGRPVDLRLGKRGIGPKHAGVGAILRRITLDSKGKCGVISRWEGYDTASKSPVKPKRPGGPSSGSPLYHRRRRRISDHRSCHV